MLTPVSSGRLINPVVRMASDPGEAFPPEGHRLPGGLGDNHRAPEIALARIRSVEENRPVEVVSMTGHLRGNLTDDAIPELLARVEEP